MSLHLEFLLEEPSMEAFLSNFLPKILPSQITYNLHSFNSKQALLKNIKNRLDGYSKWIPSNYRIIIIVDEDRDDCLALKDQIVRDIQAANLICKSSVGINQSYQCAVRICVEELESWFFGDCLAINKAFPRVSPNLGSQAKYRNPDAIKGGTWEALERVLQRAGYYGSGIPKVEVAEKIAPYMDASKNSSNSFRSFHELLIGL